MADLCSAVVMPLGVELWLLRRIICPRDGTRGIILSPLRGSMWYFIFPWVSTHGCFISPLCGSMWLPCNNYELCIMNYALKKAHGCVMSPLCGSMWLPYNNYELCIMNYALNNLDFREAIGVQLQVEVGFVVFF